MAKELRGKCAGSCGVGESDLISSYAEMKEPPFSTAYFLDSVSRDSILRKGKWTTEEEDYATKIISLFNRGLLPIGAGTTLRSYLSDKLNWYAIVQLSSQLPQRTTSWLLADRCEISLECLLKKTLFAASCGDSRMIAF